MSGKSDCEKLLNAVLPVAERMLSQFGEFYPYGGYMRLDGEIIHVGAEDEDTEHPKSKDLLYVLRDSFSEKAAMGACKATAIVFDVRVVPPGAQEKSDAVQVCLEHADGYSAEIFLPYRIDQDGRVTYGAMFAQEGKHDIFGKSQAR
jgi:hypothetical protein